MFELCESSGKYLINVMLRKILEVFMRKGFRFVINVVIFVILMHEIKGCGEAEMK